VASPSAPVHPARYLTVFLILVIGGYLLVFLTGDKRVAPKLGIDLQGGTRVTLTARTLTVQPRHAMRCPRRGRSLVPGSTVWVFRALKSLSTETTWSSRCRETTATRRAT
jgi:preprotein translocase subunit SecF